MKVVILAGGYGTRITEETVSKPKPMIELGGMPILIHIMNIFSYYGINDFIICTGYKQTVIKEYFSNYFLYSSDVTFDFVNNETKLHQTTAKPWKVTLVNTGEHTMTGGRLKRIKEYVKNEEAFCMTYGDGVSDVDIKALIKFHKEHKKLATLTAVNMPARFGALEIKNNMVLDFREKSSGDSGNINAGFFVLSPKALDYIENDQTSWEQEPLKNLASDGQLAAYYHSGFWQCMDNIRDKAYLEDLLAQGDAKWIK